MKTQTLELFLTAIETLEAKVATLEVAASGVPSAQAILDGVLAETGHGEAWADGSLSGDDRLKVLHEVRLAGRRWLRAKAQAVLDGLGEKALLGRAKAAVGAFFGHAKKYVREIVAAGLLVIAGPGPVTQQEAIAEAYEQQVKIQAEYLADFRKQVVAGDKPLDGTFVSRAEQYGNSAWSASQQVMRAFYAKRAIFDQEMREHIGKDTPCATCIEEVAKGWQPIGTLRAVGDSICKSGCHCRFVFRKGKDGVPHVAGRGPLFDAAFGTLDKSLVVPCVWDPILKAYVPCRDERGRFASCGGTAGQAKPKPGVKPKPGAGGGKKPRKPKEPKVPKEPKKPAAKPPKEPKPPKTPKEPKPKVPKEPKKPAEKKPPKEKPPKAEKPPKEAKPPKEKPKKPEAKPEPKPEKSPLPAPPGPGESWTISPDQAKDWVKDSVFPQTLYHRTYPPAKADIEANGINMKKTTGVYGQGLYASTKHEKSFGPSTVEVALNIRNPLIGTGDDIHRLQREWGPPGMPLHSTGFRDEVVRRGYDSVIMHWEPTYQGPGGNNWVVVMKPETARFIQQ